MAKDADATLSKLITAKSPAVIDWMRNRDLDHKTEDQVVREWRVYYTRLFVLNKYPLKNKALNTPIEAFMNSVYKKSFPEGEKKKFEKLFAQSKNAALDTIRSFHFSKPIETAIVNRVSAIRLYWMGNYANSRFAQKPLEAVSWGVAYDPVVNQINMGIEALSYLNENDPSESTLLFVFAHEIGHAFDPCRWGAFFEGVANPFEPVIQCLRDPKSAGVRARDDSKMEEFLNSKKLSQEIFFGLKANPSCNKAEYPPVGIQADQAPEAFADWFSAEAIGGSKLTIQSARQDLCESRDLNLGSSYPSNFTRLDAIYLVQPDVLKKLKMAPTGKYKYCKVK